MRARRATERRYVDVHADVGVGHEAHPLRRQLGEPAVQDALLHLELGDAVAQEAAYPVGALEDGHRVTGPSELLGRGEPGGARTDDGHRLAGRAGWWPGDDPAGLEGAIDDSQLDRLDRDRVVVDPQDAGALAGRRAEGAGELREVVGGVQPVDRVPELVAIDEVVPVGDEVSEGTPLMAEGDAAVHAAGALASEGVGRPRQHDLAPVVETLGDRPVRLLAALELDEARDLSHGATRAPLP